MADMRDQADVLIEILRKRKHAIGCEVGVHTGTTTFKILNRFPKMEKYYTVDPWESYKQYDGTTYRKPGHKRYKTWNDAYSVFKTGAKKFENIIEICKMTSVEAAKKISDESLDWVFIDANHEYEYIKENLYLWTPKVKKNGIVSGHDYGGKWTGIKKAVDEFVPSDTTLNVEPFYVWWFVK
jgi:predicted O-methyltransferase YrrM